MITKIITPAILAISLGFVGPAEAAMELDGSFGTFNLGGGAYTASTLTLTADNYVNSSIAGDFTSLLPQYSLVTAYSSQITGISSAPTPETISDFFEIASPDSLFGAQGTVPSNRFDFDLSTLAYLGNGVFDGTGTLVDNNEVYASSPASFTVAFSGPGTYSVFLSSEAGAAVPEARAYGICAGALSLIALATGLLCAGRKGTLAV